MNPKDKIQKVESRMSAQRRKTRSWKSVVMSMACVVVFVTTYALILPAITMAKDTFCGLEEHTHTEECYAATEACVFDQHEHDEACVEQAQVLTCALEEMDAHEHDESCFAVSDVLVCELEESEEHTHQAECYQQMQELICPLEATQGHTHSEECFTFEEAYVCEAALHEHTDECMRVLVCELEEHTHTDQCYSNPEADADASEWTARLPGRTGSWNQDLLNAARSQVGYTASIANYLVREDGTTSGYTIYGAAYGIPYDTWDGAFVSWCMGKAGIPEWPNPVLGEMIYVPRAASAGDLLSAVDYASLYSPKSDGYIPEAGDLIFFYLNEEGRLRVGVVAESTVDPVTGGLAQVRMILGDSNHSVEERTWSVNEMSIQGYCALPENPALQPPAEEEILPEEAEDPEEILDEEELTADEPEMVIEEKPEEEDPVGDEEIEEAEPEADLPAAGSGSYAPPADARIWATVDAVAPKRRMMMAFGISPLADAPEGSRMVLASGEEGHGNLGTTKVQWRLPGETAWRNFDDTSIPANAELQITIEYGNVDPSILAANGYKLYYYAEDIMEKLTAVGEIRKEGEVRGVITAQTVEENGVERTVIVQDFSVAKAWVDSLGTSTMQGTFSYQGRLDLGKLEDAGGDSVNLAGITIHVPDVDDAVAHFASLDLAKTRGDLVMGQDGKYYIEYTLTVTAGPYGSPDVKLIDHLTAGASYFDGFVGVNGTAHSANAASAEYGPVETNNLSGRPVGEVYLTDDNGAVRGAMPTPNPDGTKLAWAIGDMQANESRTLTYRVQVKDSYIGIAHVDDPITNSASLFSKDFDRGTKTTTYVAKADARISKAKGEAYQRDTTDPEESKWWYIDFETTIRANSDNVYPLSDVKLWDVANSGSGASYAQHVELVPDSVRLYEGDGVTEMNLGDYTGYTASNGNPGTRNNPRINNPRNFDVFVGDMDPGEVRVVKYTMRINLDAATASGNGQIGIFNTAHVLTDENRQNRDLHQASTGSALRSITWMQKSAPGQTAQGITVTFPGGAQVFDGTGNTSGLATLPAASHGASYSIPGGSYQYRVVINESGEWDVTSANWADSIQANANDGLLYMRYLQYVQVDAYDTVARENGSTYGVNEDGSTTPKKTVWVKVDKNTSFSFTGKQIGMDGDDAYIMTYYTEAIVPNGVNGYGTAYVDNDFRLSGGVVGPGGQVYYLTGVTDRVNVTAREPGVENPLKVAWYYDAADASFKQYHGGEEHNGALYWVIKMTGDKIPRGMSFQESTRIPDVNPEHYMRNNESLIGFYLIDFGDAARDSSTAQEFLDRYPNLNSFLADINSDRVREVPTDIYSQNWSGYTSDTYGNNGKHYDLTMTFTDDYLITSGEALYLIVRTDPVSMPANGSSQSYQNKVNYYNPSMGNIGNWPNSNTSQTIVAPQGSLDKDVQGVYTVKNGVFTKLDSDYADVYTDVALDRTDWNATSGGNMSGKFADGTYVLWSLAANRARTIQGAATIIDTLPEGMELVYAYTSDVHGMFNNRPAAFVHYTGPDITSMSGSNAYYRGVTWAWTATGESPALAGAGWEKHMCASRCTTATQSRNATMTTYYTNGREVGFYLPAMRGFQADIQVLCRLSDDLARELLMQDVESNNQATMYDANGRRIESDGATVTISGGNVNKNLLMDGLYNQVDGDKLASTRFPYTIVINDEASDMMPGAGNDTITIPFVDRMTGNMSLDLTTLKIYRDSESDENLLYYGGMYSMKPSDMGRPWFDPSREGAPVGYLGDGTPITVATRAAANEKGPILGVDGNPMKEIVFRNLPDETKLIITYSVSVTLQNGSSLHFNNKAFWEGYERNSGGESEEVIKEYLADSEVSETKHGAVHIIKYDADNMTNRLAGAEFTLYRAAYQVASAGKVLVGGEPVDSQSGHYLAVYQGTNYGSPTTDPEIRVDRNSDGTIFKVEILTPNGPEWVPVNNALSRGYNLHHDFLVVNGELQVYMDEVLAIGSTDENGNLSYGFGSDMDYGERYVYNAAGERVPVTGTLDSENRIHFNKVYAVVETVAPEGYVLDPTPHFFVIPNDHGSYNGQGQNYFFHHAWPNNVHVCTQSENDQITFMLNAGNERPRLTVTKDFAGGLDAYQPGSYTVGVWADDLTERPSRDNMLYSLTFTYTEEDFGYYNLEGTATQVYGLLPDHAITMELPATLEFGTYRMYELNDAGYPIINMDGTASGTVNGLTYTVNLEGDSAGSNGVIVYDSTHHDVTVLNETYTVQVVKQFSSLSGHLLGKGVSGTYRFGIWPANEIDPATGLPTTPVDVRNVREATWVASDTDAEKKLVFSGLDHRGRYYVFELDEDNKPVSSGSTFMQDGIEFAPEYVGGNTADTGKQLADSVEIVNNAIVTLPLTGGMGSQPFTFGGLLLLSIGLVYYICLRRRKGKEDKAL